MALQSVCIDTAKRTPNIESRSKRGLQYAEGTRIEHGIVPQSELTVDA